MRLYGYISNYFQAMITILRILKIRRYALLAVSVMLLMALVIPISTLAISGMWIYSKITITLFLTLTSYMLSGVFIALYSYSKGRTLCKGEECMGITGTILSIVGCCSPVIYVLFISGLITSFIIPFLTIIPITSILLLLTAIFLLANRVERAHIERRWLYEEG